MRVLLIGATGQIGYALATALAKTEHEISVLVREASRLAFPGCVKVMESNSFDAVSFREALTNIDHVIYGVGLPAQFLSDEAQFDRVNRGLLEQFLAELRGLGPFSLTYVSTYEVFEAQKGLIRESHPVADERAMTSYFRAMTQAYRLVIRFAAKHGLQLTTIHPAAVYGGLNTGDGITNYVENLANRRFWRVPFVVSGRFPVVHVESLADAIVKSLGRQGAYIMSDQMTTLQEIARTVKGCTNSYVPVSAPLWLAKAGTGVLEVGAKVWRQKPVMARVQIEFITKGLEPRPDKAIVELGWKPLPLATGVWRYLRQRAHRPGFRSGDGGSGG